MRKERHNGRMRCQWHDGQERVFILSLKAAFNWALEYEMLNKNPLRALKAPPARTSASDLVLKPEQQAQILDACSGTRQIAVRRFVVALEATGARPGELANARVSDWNGDLGAVVYYADHKRREDEFRHKPGAKRRSGTASSPATSRTSS
jgi:integrase